MSERVDSLIDLWMALWMVLTGAEDWPVLAHPEAFALLLLPAGLALWSWRRRARLDDYADPSLRPWAFAGGQTGRGRLGGTSRLLWLLFWLFAALALADPRLPQSGETMKEARAPLLFVVDGSAAMSGRDVEPDRIGRAVLLMELLAESDPGRPMGLLRYSDTTGVLLPPSLDPDLLTFYARELPGLVDARLEVRPDQAFAVAAEMAALDGGAVVWLTSADERQLSGVVGSQLLAAVERLEARDIPVLAVSMAREETSLYSDGQLLRNEQHEILTSRPLFERVAEVARFAGGVALRTGVLREDAAFLAEEIAALPAPPHREGAFERYRSLAPLALWLAMVALAIHLWFEWADRRGPGRARRTVLAVGLIVLAPILFTVAQAAPVVDHATQQIALDEGWAALETGEFGRAQVAFDRATGYAARLGSGLAAYRRGDIPHAIERLQMAAWLAESPEPRMLALFNLGNALVLAGRYWAAVSAFDAVLALDPEHEPALQNRLLAEALVDMERDGVGEEEPGFRGYAAMRPDPIDETQGARMSDEFHEGEGAGGATAVSGGERQAEPFQLNEGLLQGARKKLERIEDHPQPAIEGLLRQQPYKSVVEQHLSGEGGP